MLKNYTRYMKCSKLLCIVIAILIAIPMYGKKKISIRGIWGKSEKSLIYDLPIQAWIEDSNEELSLFFDNDLGTIYVTIKDSLDTIIYNQDVNTKEISSFVIPLNDIKGDYILSITDGNNQIYGQFSIY